MCGQRFSPGFGGTTAVLASFVSIAALTGQANAAPLELDWSAPPGCPDRQQVLAAIQRLIGAQGAGAARLSVQGEIVARDETLELKLVWRTGSAQTERLMESASCDELARAAALVVALAADPTTPHEVQREVALDAPTEPPPAPSPTRLMSTFFEIDTMIGRTFEAGLAQPGANAER